jgi:hypothetical protein
LKRVSTLRVEKEQLQEPLDEHAGLLSTMRTLPRDILSGIFIAGLSGRPEVVFELSSWPYTISEVCPRWRKVARATPALWSSMDTMTDLFDDTRKVALLMLWKGRVK